MLATAITRRWHPLPCRAGVIRAAVASLVTRSSSSASAPSSTATAASDKAAPPTSSSDRQRPASRGGRVPSSSSTAPASTPPRSNKRGDGKKRVGSGAPFVPAVPQNPLRSPPTTPHPSSTPSSSPSSSPPTAAAAARQHGHDANHRAPRSTSAVGSASRGPSDRATHVPVDQFSTRLWSLYTKVRDAAPATNGGVSPPLPPAAHHSQAHTAARNSPFVYPNATHMHTSYVRQT